MKLFKDNLSILQVLPRLNSGGVERGTLDMVDALKASGAKPLVASNGGHLVKQVGLRGGKHIQLPLASHNPLQIILNIFALAHLIKKENVSLIHARSRAPAWSAYFAAKLTDIPFITTYHATYSEQNRLKKLYNSVMARGLRVIAISDSIKTHIMNRYGSAHWMNKNHIRLIHRGVDLEYFTPSSVDDARLTKLRQLWQLSDDTRILLLPGRLARWKGQHILLHALSMMKPTNLQCIIVGSSKGKGTYLNDLQAFIKTHKLTQTIKWVDECQDMPAAYMLADIVVSTSTSPEGFGRIMAEAQAMHKPVIAFNHGGATEIIEHEKTGWLVSPQDASTLAKTLSLVLSLPQKTLKAMGNKGRKRVEDYFSLKEMQQKTLQVYQEILSAESL